MPLKVLMTTTDFKTATVPIKYFLNHEEVKIN